MSVDIDLTPVNPGTGDPVSIVCKNTTDLMDIYFLFAFFTPKFIDLDGNRKCLFRNNKSIEISIDC